jgi:hypothetical protein
VGRSGRRRWPVLDGWIVGVARQAIVALPVGARALQGRGETFVQAIGAPARRVNPQRL